MSQPDFYQDRDKADAVVKEFEEIQKQLSEDYELWDELEAKREGLDKS